ncbi:MAG TPA: sulfite exporter TauE/SafE family protein [Terriglobia bacterium]|nr:sulfite exporter TauE/SafE family protein [Terriglobia bacterium]
MTLPNAILLFVAAGLAGALNSVAGGGSFISFPALIFTRVLPIPANATSTVALWPGTVASVGAYRTRFPKDFRIFVEMVATSLTGGTLGALILLRTPQSTFMHFVPYLFLLATLLLIFGKELATWVETTFKTSKLPHWLVVLAANFFQFLIALYGGFFGAGIGIMMLALLTMLRMEDIHAMNALKTLLNAAINGAAVVTFIAAGVVLWPQALVMIGGAVMGGYGGAHFAQELDPQIVRRFVIAVGLGMSAYFFVRR